MVLNRRFVRAFPSEWDPVFSSWSVPDCRWRGFLLLILPVWRKDVLQTPVFAPLRHPPAVQQRAVYKVILIFLSSLSFSLPAFTRAYANTLFFILRAKVRKKAPAKFRNVWKSRTKRFRMDKMTGIRACRKRGGSPDAPAQSGKIPFPGQVSGTDFIHKQKRRKEREKENSWNTESNTTF